VIYLKIQYIPLQCHQLFIYFFFLRIPTRYRTSSKFLSPRRV